MAYVLKSCSIAVFTIILMMMQAFAETTDTPQPEFEYVEIPGTRVSLQVPPGFELSDFLSGVTAADGEVSVGARESPISFQQYVDTFEPGTMFDKDFKILSSEPIGPNALGTNPPPEDFRRQLVRTEGRSGGVARQIFILIEGNQHHSIILFATLPSAKSEVYESLLIKVLTTARWNSTGEKFAKEYPFRVAETSDLKREIIPGMEQMFMMAGPSSAAEPGSNAPRLAIMPWTPPSTAATLSEMTDMRLSEMRRVEDIRIRSRSPLKINGLDAYTLTANALRIRDDVWITFTLTMVKHGSKVYALLGTVDMDRWAKYEPQFNQVRDSFSLD